MGLDYAVDTHRLGISPGQAHKFACMASFADFIAKAALHFSLPTLPS